MKKSKVTYKQIEDFNKGVSILFEKNCTVSAEIGMEYMLAQGNCEKHVKVIATEKDRLAKKMGEDNKNGTFSIKNDKLDSFYKEMDKIESKSVSIELPSIKIKKKDLEGMKLPMDFFKLLKDYLAV